MEKLSILGWREWVSLPDLGIDTIKCKVDTGARTSALHAFFIDYNANQNLVNFKMHPIQNRIDIEQHCVAPVLDQRIVTDSGGHKESRFVIQTRLHLGDDSWPIEVTLTDRDNMRFRMLLGRTAINKRFLVNPSASYLIGKFKRTNK